MKNSRFTERQIAFAKAIPAEGKLGVTARSTGGPQQWGRVASFD
jgi:hypothetical protein